MRTPSRRGIPTYVGIPPVGGMGVSPMRRAAVSAAIPETSAGEMPAGRTGKTCLPTASRQVPMPRWPPRNWAWFKAWLQSATGPVVRSVPVRASEESPYGDTTNQNTVLKLVPTVTLI